MNRIVICGWLMLVFTGCGASEGTDSLAATESQSEEVWSTGELSPTRSENQGEGAAPYDGEDDYEDDYEDDDEEEEWDDEEDGPAVPEAFWGGEASVVVGSTYAGIGEFYVEDRAGEIICWILWDVESVAVVDSCADCLFAFELERSNVSLETDTDGACGTYGVAVGDLQNSRVFLGFRDEQIVVQESGTWVARPSAEFNANSGEFSYEYLVGDDA